MNNLIGFDKSFNKLLENYKSMNLHSSIIFYGPKGIGKRKFINNFINEIIKINFEPNDFAHHNNLFLKNTHPNIMMLEREIDSKTKKLKKNINIDQIRILKKFINESASLKKMSKFIIFDSADDLNINSANSLLKNLEEPNKNTFIFLICHNLSSLIPTIRSRCLKIKMNKHNLNDFKKILLDNIDIDNDDDINFLYDLSHGSPGSAISLYEGDILDTFDITVTSLISNEINKDKVNLSNLLADLENDRFQNYLSFLKSILIILNKIKDNNYDSNYFLSKKLNILNNASNHLTKKNIIDRFDFLINNEKDLFTYNLDKKLFMLKFLAN